MKKLIKELDYTQPEKPVRIFSNGGGWQSIATFLLQIEGKIKPFDYYVYANVDDRAEPETVAYIDTYIKPLADKHGIKMVTVQKMRDGKPYGLLDDLFNDDNKRVALPMWNDRGAPNSRICTSDWKINIVDKWIKDNGFQYVELGMGISMDESERVNAFAMDWHDYMVNKKGEQSKRKFGYTKKIVYPLIEELIWREQLEGIFERHGLPTPPKSACFFCPFGNRTRWIELKRNKPELFKLAVEIEQQANKKTAHIEDLNLFLHVSRTTLNNAVSDQLPLWDFETGGGCDSGVCFT